MYNGEDLPRLRKAAVVELVYTLVLGTSGATHASSSLARGTSV